MNGKNLLIVLVILIGVIGILGWKIKSASGSNVTSAISLSTDPNPVQLGQNTFVMLVKDKDGKAVDNAIVSFDLNMTTMNMGIQQGNATPQGNGKYLTVGRLSMLGPWRFSVIVAMPDGSSIKKDFNINVSR